MPPLKKDIFDKVKLMLETEGYTVETGEVVEFWSKAGVRPLLHLRAASESRIVTNPRAQATFILEIRALVTDEFGRNIQKLFDEDDKIIETFRKNPDLDTAGVIDSFIESTEFNPLEGMADMHLLARLNVRYHRNVQGV